MLRTVEHLFLLVSSIFPWLREGILTLSLVHIEFCVKTLYLGTLSVCWNLSETGNWRSTGSEIRCFPYQGREGGTKVKPFFFNSESRKYKVYSASTGTCGVLRGGLQDFLSPSTPRRALTLPPLPKKKKTRTQGQCQHQTQKRKSQKNIMKGN